MTANNDLQRRLAGYYASEPPLRAPDWVLQSALETIEDTRQRRGLVALRRYSDMPQLKLAAAAAIVIAVGAFALWQLAPPGVGPRAVAFADGSSDAHADGTLHARADDVRGAGTDGHVHLGPPWPLALAPGRLDRPGGYRALDEPGAAVVR